MKIPMSQRLLACCSYVNQGDRVADIGCDHGYLGIYLLTNGIARSTIESDVAPQPLESARRNARKFHVDSAMTFCLSDGARDIPRDFDCMVCAGMGADTIVSILHHAPWLRDPKYRLILQCQSKRPELRQWLYDAGYRISRETLAKDGKFVYSVMEAVYDPGFGITPAEAYISPALLADGHPLLGEYYERVLHGVRLSVEGMRRSGDCDLPVFERVLSDLKALEGKIYGNRS